MIPAGNTIAVNDAADSSNSTDGRCTLREAITAANTNVASGPTPGECNAGSNSDPDTITFSITGTISLASALPDLNSTMTISGPGSSQLTVQRSTANGTSNFRIFTVSSGATVNLSGMTITNGRTPDGVVNAQGNPGDGGPGGGILNSGTLTLTSVVVSGNLTGNGAQSTYFSGKGGAGGGIYNSGSLTLISSTVTGNQTGNGVHAIEGTGASGYGGGIANGGPNGGGGTVTLTDSSISGNHTGSFIGFGGGIYVDSGNVTLTNTAVYNNTASYLGGGISERSGTLTAANSLVYDNNCVDFGCSAGGISNSGTMTLTNTLVSGNRADQQNSRAGGIQNEGTLRMSNSTVFGNYATLDGGGIYNRGGVTLTNSTVTGNTAAASGGGLYNTDTGGDIILNNSTVSGNTSNVGGGMANKGHVISLKNTIVADNLPTGENATGIDLSGTFTSQDYNLIGNTFGATFTGTTTHDLTNVIARLGTFAQNGGPTSTVMPLPGSPAINAGDPVNLPPDTFDLDNNGNTIEPLPVDQRGFPRVIGGSFDIGAVETNYAISATAGTPQSAQVNQVFATALKATVTESGMIKSGIPVVFTAPSSGASGTFPGNLMTATVNTGGGSGVATAPTFTANATAGGPYNVIASLGPGLPTAAFSLTNLKRTQTISFGALSNKTFGDTDFSITATATSGLAVSFAAAGPCTVNGSTVHLTGVGSCMITASQAGDNNYDSAAPVSQSFDISVPFWMTEAGTNRVISLDSVTFIRDPFPIASYLNFSTDHYTRVILFTSNLGLSQPNPSLLSVQAGGFPLPVEAVGPMSAWNGSYIVVKLVDGLPVGDVPIAFTLRGVTSTTGIIGIAP